MLTDEELMLAAGKGDLGAFEQIVLRYEAALWSIAYRFLGDRTGAEDIAQEAFLRVFESAPRYRPTAALGTYLRRVVINLCLDRARRKQPQQLSAEGLELSASRKYASPSPLDALVSEERDEAVRRALDKLPARQRMALVLRHYEGLSYREIATVMGTSAKAVERLLARARASLEVLLRDLLRQ